MIENLIQQIDKQAKNNPTKIAYNYLGKTNTYKELTWYSDNLAEHLGSIGLEPHSPIMVYGGQTFDMLVAFLGCVKAGHAYIPVNAGSSEERIKTIMTTAKPALVIAVTKLSYAWKKGNVINLAELKSIYKHQPRQQSINHGVSFDDNFYIIFTSGTTGQPKGVQISHRNLLSFVNWMVEDYDFTNKKTLLQPPFSFDLSVMALYPTLAMGGTLEVLPEKMTKNFKDMFAVFDEMKPQIWVSTPSLVDIYLIDPFFNQKHYPQLKQFFFCGEELTHKTAAKLKKCFPSAQIYNTYGPTEATVAVSSVEITTDILGRYDRLPIGYVKKDTHVKIGDQTGRIGEIVITGPSVSKGYLNNINKTNQVFGTSKQTENQFYKTGDLGYFDDDLLFYNGRKDFQIKMNGFRIELEEINHYLSEASILKQGVVIPRYGKDHKVKQLLAFVVAGGSEPYTIDDYTQRIRQYLTEKLMPYMMPQRFIYRQSLPTNVNGKIDIKSLIKEVNGNG